MVVVQCAPRGAVVEGEVVVVVVVDLVEGEEAAVVV